MVRTIVAVVIGVVTWFAAVTLLNLALRYGWPAYAAVEKAMTFTLAMLAARLAMSFVASLAGGAIAAKVGKCRAAAASGGLLLVLFLPVHYGLWAVFPVWYHLAFLASLPLLAGAGGRLVTARSR